MNPRPASLAAPLSLLLLGLAIFLLTLGKLPLIRGEAMYALIPADMLARGDWLTPYLNDARYLDKPPVFYWLVMAFYQIFGVSDASARLAVFAIGLGEVLAVFLIGRRLFSLRAGWLSGLVLLTSIGFFTLHEQLFTDHLITLTLVWSVYFLLCWQARPRLRFVLAFQLCLAAGLLSKGLVGLFFPLAVGGVYLLATRDWRLFRFFLHPAGLAFFVLLAAPWFVVMTLRHPGFFEFHVLNEQILRFLGKRHPPDIITFPILGFWLFVVVWLMPWAAFLPAALASFWPRPSTPASARPGRLLVLIWAGVVLIFFSLSSLRIEYYSLPAFPALALILGWRFDLYLSRPRDRAVQCSLLVFAVLMVALLALPPVLESLSAGNRREFLTIFGELEPVVRRARFWLPALGLTAALLGWWGRPRLCLAGLAATAAAVLFFTFQCLQLVNASLTDRPFGVWLADRAAPGDLVVMEALEEFEYAASLRFYGAPPVLLVQRRGLPAFGFPLRPEENFIISPETLRQLWEGPRRVFLLVDDHQPLEDYLQHGHVMLAAHAKRLLSNRPGP